MHLASCAWVQMRRRTRGLPVVDTMLAGVAAAINLHLMPAPFFQGRRTNAQRRKHASSPSWLELRWLP
eukprot:37288-Pelagomonas_calceolata.AAC.3